MGVNEKEPYGSFFHFKQIPPLHNNVAPTGLCWFWHYIYIALTDYAIQYRPYGATRLQTNNPNGVTLPSIVREGYENVREDYENTTTPQPQP